MDLKLGSHMAGPADFHGTSHEWYVLFAGIDHSAVLLLDGGDPGLVLALHLGIGAVTPYGPISPASPEELVDFDVVLLIGGRICNVALDLSKQLVDLFLAKPTSQMRSDDLSVSQSIARRSVKLTNDYRRLNGTTYTLPPCAVQLA